MSEKNPYKPGQILITPDGRRVRAYQSGPNFLNAYDLETGTILVYDHAKMRPAEYDHLGIEAHRSDIVLIGYAKQVIDMVQAGTITPDILENWQVWYQGHVDNHT